MEVNNTQQICFVISIVAMCLGQSYGIYKAIKHWNDKEKDSFDIFLYLSTYWLVGIFAGFLFIPFFIVAAPVYILRKLRE